MPPITPAPTICPSCPWRINITPTAEQVAAVQDAIRTLEPQRCTSRGDRYIGTVCRPWLAACGPTSPAVVAAVASGEVRVASLARQPNWPAVHESAGAVVAAVYRTPEQRRVDPLMVALREAREQAGLTQRQAATRVGVDEATVRNDETGRTSPPLHRLRAYCDVYGVDLHVRPR